MTAHRLISLFFVVALAVAALPGCGEEEDGGLCSDEGQSVDGLRGVVVTPNCAAAMSDATVTALHGSGLTLTVQTDAQGQFAFPSSQLMGNTGRWGLSAQKGPFSAPRTEVTVAADGSSDFVVIAVQQ